MSSSSVVRPSASFSATSSAIEIVVLRELSRTSLEGRAFCLIRTTSASLGVHSSERIMRPR